MKLFNKIALSVFSFSLAFVLNSCNKDISLKPLNFVTTDQTNAAQLNNQLAGVYNVLEATEMYGLGLWGYFSTGADDFFGTDEGSATTTSTQTLTASYRSTSSDATYAGLWKDLYLGIERANVLLSVINQPAIDSVTRANIKGQALFLRAYYFYLLVNNFGDIPYKSVTTSSLGTNFNLSQTPSKAIYDSIINDMSAADSLVLPITTTQTTTVVSKSAVEGVLARVCMSAAGYPVNGGMPYYQKALFWSTKLIASGIHSLNGTPHSQYPNTPAYARVFINNMQNNYFENNTSEGIWDAAFLSNGVGAYASLGYLVTQQLGVTMGITCPGAARATGTYRPYPNFYNLFANGDQRKDWVMTNYLLDSSNRRLYALGVKVTINPGRKLTPRDTLYKKGIPYIQYDTTYFGSGATAVATVNDTTGAITAITVTNGGSGYTLSPAFSVTVSAPSTGKGLLYKSVLNPANGSVTSITVTNPGVGYVTQYDRPVAKWRREYELTPIKNLSYTSSNFPIIRYSDVLLMAAEADLMVNGGSASAQGIEYFNQVRRRAFGLMPNAVGSQYDATSLNLDTIKAERSRELCFEGVRRSDLKRWGLSSMIGAFNNVLTSISSYDATVGYTSTSILPAAVMAPTNFISNPQKYFYFPIPASEIALDPNLSQNQGW